MENPDDRRFLVEKARLAPDSVVLIRGIGVDTRRFAPGPEPQHETPVVTLVSRMLWPKGIGELVDAVRILRQRGVAVRVQLVGTPDSTSRVAVPQRNLEQWDAEGIIDWLGHRDDIPDIWRGTDIAILPSYYREGIPRSLLEAAASARPIITTDMPGCREIVRDGVNGLLIRPRDPVAIADAIERLAGDPALRRQMGAAARAMVEAEFTEQIVVEQMLNVYRRLAGKLPDVPVRSSDR